ncbi:MULTISPECIES: zinc ribbon domain-containing protein [unclassified Streptomyces]|uniref:zinc ribbon domain-containing protein n=1 Tax=unclassified Streptomyces TaxID=2593676 RepID=UPI002475E415|nr:MULTISPECIES: zinc ribbon domain-containing protein [unclassified Streptomyces]
MCPWAASIPRTRSKTCAECGRVDQRGRVDQGLFIWRGCGGVAHADRNASHTLATRGANVWSAGRIGMSGRK